MLAPIMNVLNEITLTFYNLTNNYGAAIILLTLLVGLITLPLRHKSLTSARRMQEMQPELKKIKEKYKNDKEKQNKATMELLAKHKVNPVAGCLPLLIQVPIMFAMFRVLQSPPEAVENFMLLGLDMRVSVNMLWDAGEAFKPANIIYFLLVILSGATTFWQQKITMTDQSQKALLIMMPLMLTYFSLNFQSGLVMYWTINNFLSIVHQVIINKFPMKYPMKEEAGSK